MRSPECHSTLFCFTKCCSANDFFIFCLSAQNVSFLCNCLSDRNNFHHRTGYSCRIFQWILWHHRSHGVAAMLEKRKTLDLLYLWNHNKEKIETWHMARTPHEVQFCFWFQRCHDVIIGKTKNTTAYQYEYFWWSSRDKLVHRKKRWRRHQLCGSAAIFKKINK